MNDTSPNSDNTQKRLNASVLPYYETANFAPCGPKFQRLRTYVQQLCNGTLNALYVCGPPGTFKLMTIKHELDQLKQKYVECNAPLSAKEMIQLLKRNPRKRILIKHSSLLHLNPDVANLVLRLVKKDHALPVTPDNKPEWICPVPKFTGSLIFLSDFPFGEDEMAEDFDGEEFLKVHYPTDDEINDCLDEWAELVVDSTSGCSRQAVLKWLNESRCLYFAKVRLNIMLARFEDLQSEMLQFSHSIENCSEQLASAGATLFEIRP